ncbi:neutral/alkaline non-lysosomal ceramidase N-terminal domain-containing protein [Tautonia plasticadhaerens]|uniref:Neutral/alkaline non-lysosomal ceramidase n=1 Tax=Tautonia plasticadhaerens TaxID=2527974 RepID=A0A518HCJ8_9BACT|nr:neutral/alkaline non-lysosomal ceramidase N-terminal domain-containing protein [Tautonia plasticadhaerens]QDV38582.1 Neutral/alkaline non-lysosomal ceramidase [Tautonia plasticadhaerens]
MSPIALLAPILSLLFPSHRPGPPEGPEVLVGVARVDVTPEGPIRLTGYGNRATESDGVTHPLWAKALAIGGDEGEGPAVLITVDNLGISDAITSEIADRLADATGLPRDRLAICASHTHSAPALTDVAPFIFAEAPPQDQQARIDRYTARLTDQLAEVARAALEARRPGHLSWAVGSVGFAANRRVLRDGTWSGFGVSPDAPVDHSLPVLRVADPDGTTRAVLASYACHCTTLSGDFNAICGDWAGFAQEDIERDHPGAVALIAIGCGADANPEPRGELSQAKAHGRSLARAVSSVLKRPMTPISGVTRAGLARVDLPFADLPSRADWEVKAGLEDQEGRRARSMLALLDRGDAIPTALEGYPVQVWAFGDDLAMVFLAGEVVVDYAVHLRRVADPARLWINAYSNDAPCYIASDRLLGEGGYEVDSSMIYYGQPTRFAPGVEGRVVDAVLELIPAAFRAEPGGER